jgi:hypothetical protein
MALSYSDWVRTKRLNAAGHNVPRYGVYFSMAEALDTRKYSACRTCTTAATTTDTDTALTAAALTADYVAYGLLSTDFTPIDGDSFEGPLFTYTSGSRSLTPYVDTGSAGNATLSTSAPSTYTKDNSTGVLSFVNSNANPNLNSAGMTIPTLPSSIFAIEMVVSWNSLSSAPNATTAVLLDNTGHNTLVTQNVSNNVITTDNGTVDNNIAALYLNKTSVTDLTRATVGNGAWKHLIMVFDAAASNKAWSLFRNISGVSAVPASVQLVRFWTRALSSSEVTTIYNDAALYYTFS